MEKQTPIHDQGLALSVFEDSGFALTKRALLFVITVVSTSYTCSQTSGNVCSIKVFAWLTAYLRVLSRSIRHIFSLLPPSCNLKLLPSNILKGHGLSGIRVNGVPVRELDFC